MNYGKEFREYATKHHGISSMHYDKIVSSVTPYIIEVETIKRSSDGCFFSIDDGPNYFSRNCY